MESIQRHLNDATEALNKHKAHSKELKDSVKTSKGVAKRELKKLLKVSDQHVKDIEAEISEANKAFAEKKSKLEKYEKKDAKQ